MKKSGIDTAAAWFIAVFLAVVGLTTSYFIVNVASTDPHQLMMDEIEEIEKNKVKALTDAQTSEDSSKDEGEQGEKNGEKALVVDEPENSTEALWSYRGRSGPDYWGHLNSGFLNCKTGRKQSPIDINNPLHSAEEISFNMNYGFSKLKMSNTGKSYIGSFEPGSFVSFQDEIYNLKELSLHLPSEHTIDGIPYDMEMQLLHYNSEGNALAIGIFLEESRHQNHVLTKIWEAFPNEKGGESEPLHINVAELLPKDSRFFTYDGSLTTPPCTQGVHWVLFSKPAQISPDQVDKFISIYRNNSRPIQGINKRSIYVNNFKK